MCYKLLDSGNFTKLEQVGEFRLIRPALNAVWSPSLPPQEWQKAQATFTRRSHGSGGDWNWTIKSPPVSWTVKLGRLNLLVKPTNFGHLGFFAEQHQNWEWLRKVTTKLKHATPLDTLNLFAYSGGASLAMAEAGAKVCHVDAAKGMNSWGQANLQLNPHISSSIRWITDDVLKFIKRELRRKRTYRGIVLDPPSFGRGPQGELWKMEEQIVKLLEECRRLIVPGLPFFVLLSCHSPGFTPATLSRLLGQQFRISTELITSGEMTISEAGGNVLPAGCFARFIYKN